MTQRRRPFSLLPLVAAAVLIATSASPAAGSVTIGQIAPTNPPETCSGETRDLVQPTVNSGQTYVVPATGTITSWSHSATSGAGQQITMKVWRVVSGSPTTYRVVGHDGPHSPTGGVVNTYSGFSIPVQPGDVLGLNAGSTGTNCVFSAPGEVFGAAPGSDAADGQTATFSFDMANPYRTNVSAVVTPSNAITVGATTRNKKKGTATITVDVPNPGDLTASGPGVKAASVALTSKSVGAGQAQLLIKAKGKKKRKLKETGKVKLNVAVSYTPAGGDPSTQSVTVKLKKKL